MEVTMGGTSDSNRTRISLLEGIKDPANNRRWTDFYDSYSELIRTVARRSGLREDEAEDVVITVLVEVSRKIGEFAYDPSKGSFRSWLCTVTRRRAIDQFHKRRPASEKQVHRSADDDRITGTLERDLDPWDGKPITDFDKLIDSEWKQAVLDNALKRARARVTPEKYQLYDAYAVQEWTVEKVCKTFGVNANQVYMAKSLVQKIVDEEVSTVAAEMDNPSIPPEHPTLAK
jgi:RNA polymerase sigma-70 factor (ECF subfamily)